MAPSADLRCLCTWFLWIIAASVVSCYNASEPSLSNETTQSYATRVPSSAVPTQTTIHPSDVITGSQDLHPVLNQSALTSLEKQLDDTGELAGIVIGSLGAVAVILTMVGYVLYKQCMKRTVTSLNFDNPVYRKTTEDQFSLEKNQYHPAGSYPPSLEPLTSPGTNEFV